MIHRGRIFKTLLGTTLAVLAVMSWFQISARGTSSLPSSEVINSVVISTDPPKHPELSYASWITVTASDEDNVSAAEKILTTELSKYPAGHLPQDGLSNIYLVKHLVWGGQAQSAMPEAFIDHALYLSVDDEYLRAENGNYYHQLIHHEAMHLFDAAAHNTYRYQDVSWLACNPAGFSYEGSGLGFNKSGQNARTIHPENGFITSYSQSAIEEDRAEVHAYLMTTPSTVDGYAKTDPSLACKERLARINIDKL